MTLLFRGWVLGTVPRSGLPHTNKRKIFFFLTRKKQGESIKMPGNQRTPWGGGKRRGVENLTNDTPPKKGFWTPPRTVRFPPPSGVSALFFLYKNPRQSRPEALLEGSKNFRESAFSGTFSSPHTFCTPPYHGWAPGKMLCRTLVRGTSEPQTGFAIEPFASNPP